MGETALTRVLAQAWDLGFLGPGPVDEHVTHAGGYVRQLAALPSGAIVVDLGSGGGVPGLVIACGLSHLQLVLVESQQRRALHLQGAVAALGTNVRIVVRQERAEVTGRSELRGSAAAVVARSFAPPAVTAECAAPLLEVGGVLLVAEPPVDAQDRWPAGPLEELGLQFERRTTEPRLAVLRQQKACGERYPRRVGIPAKRPLW